MLDLTVAVTSKFDFRLPQACLACCALVALLAFPGALAAQTSDFIFVPPPVPKPASVRRDALPAVFRKAQPASIADLRAIERHVTALVPKISPAVVAVEIGNGSGSGVVISADGLVLTAGHVVEHKGRRALVTFPNGKTARARTIGLNDDADTGLIQITDPGPWPYVEVGDLDHARLGEWTLALGNPGGFDAARSLVVRLGRIIRLMPGVVQTDCTIFPGDSGGPLFDMYGRVIAIHTAIASSTAENFHVPITEFFDTWKEMVGGKKPASSAPLSYAGTSLINDAAGCRLSTIERDGPFSKAHLKAGDVVVKVDGRKILAAASFLHWLEEGKPGETLHLEVQRDGKLLSLPIKLEAPPRKHK